MQKDDRERATSTTRAAVALALLLAVVAGPIVQENSGLTAPRYALAAALTEHQTLVLDRYRDHVFIDRLELDGHLYSDKAPGQPFASVPAYVVGKALGAESATVVRVRGNLGLWGVTLWSSLVPALALVVLMVRRGASLGPRAATVGAAGAAFGTLLLPYAAQLYGHVLAAALGFGAWCWLRSRALTNGTVAVAGALVGAAVLVEYQMAILALVLAAWLARRAPSRLPAFAAGGAPAVVLLLLYQWALLGSPFASTYSRKPKHDGATPLITGIPKPFQAVEILLGSRGLFLFTPVVAVGLWGLWRLTRKAGPLRDDGLVGLAVLAGFFLLQAGWPNPWGGEVPGPRYMIPALPFLAVGIARAWTERRTLVVVTGAVSVFSMSWPLVARHLVPDGGYLVDSQLTDVRVFGFMPTTFTMGLGWAGWIVHVLLVLAALRFLEQTLQRVDPVSRVPSGAGRILGSDGAAPAQRHDP